MDEHNQRKFTPLDDTSRHLYQRGPNTERPRHALSSSLTTMPSAWHPDQDDIVLPQRKPSRLLRNIFVGAILFCLGAAGFMMISLMRGRVAVSNENIDIQVEAKTFVDGGENIGYRLTITNGNAVPLELADLILEYPTTAMTTFVGRGIERVREPIGTILPRQQITRAFDIVLYGEEGEERDIQATLEYRIGDSNAIFTKLHTLRVGIRSSPIGITMQIPDSTVTDQLIGIDIVLTSHSLETISDAVVQLQYPSGFRFARSEPTASSGTTLWTLGDLMPGDERTIRIEGVLSGETQEQKTFTALVGTRTGAQDDEVGVVLGSLSRIIALESPFVGASFAINGMADDQVVLDESDTVRATINWINTLPVRMSDIRFTTELTSPLIDLGTVRVQNGRYDSVTKTIIWNQDTENDLALVDPNGNGTVGFTFDTKPLVSTTDNHVISQPTVQLAVNVRATDSNGKIYTAEHVDTVTIVLNSSITLEQDTLHSSGPFANSGPLPPRANQATTYTLHWELRNTSNPLNAAKITTTLPTGVTWLGKTSPTSERVTYNSETRTVTWNPGSIVAGAGFTQPLREVYMQVAITPSSSEIGTVLDLTRDVTISATDTFTDKDISMNRPGHTTRLMGDTIEGEGIVAQ